MSNKITFGLRNVHYAHATFTEDNWSFDTPKELIGAQEFSSELVGGTNQVYADDKILHTLVSNSGQTITLKLTELSDEFKKDIFGNSRRTSLATLKIRTKTLLKSLMPRLRPLL